MKTANLGHLLLKKDKTNHKLRRILDAKTRLQADGWMFIGVHPYFGEATVWGWSFRRGRERFWLNSSTMNRLPITH